MMRVSKRCWRRWRRPSIRPTGMVWLFVCLVVWCFSSTYWTADKPPTARSLPPPLQPLFIAATTATSRLVDDMSDESWEQQERLLEHIIGRAPTSDADTAGAQIMPRLAQALLPRLQHCHTAPRNYVEFPVRLRDQQAGAIEGCAVSCERVQGPTFGALLTFVSVVSVPILCASLCIVSRLASCRSTTSHIRRKPFAPRPQRQRNDIWIPPLLLFAALGILAIEQLSVAWEGRADASNGLGEPCGWRWSSTMENPATHHSVMRWLLPAFLLRGTNDGHTDAIVRSTIALASEVPVPYADSSLPSRLYGKGKALAVAQSWAVRGGSSLLLGGSGEAEGFDRNMEETHQPTVALAAVFISNCAPQERLRWVQGLMNSPGIMIHSYGRCLHNTNEEQPAAGQSKGESTITGDGQKIGKNARKLQILRRYLFAIVFENSEATDYVSEKFYQALVSHV